MSFKKFIGFGRGIMITIIQGYEKTEKSTSIEISVIGLWDRILEGNALA